MLKLEKNSGTSDISVRLHQNERSLNAIFFTALGIALAIHLAAFLLFHIQLFKVASPVIFSPVKVLTDQISSVTALDHLDSDLTLERILPPPTETSPKLPSLPFFKSEDPLIALDSGLSSFEGGSTPILKANSPFLFPYHPVQMHISGMLAEKNLIDSSNALLNEISAKNSPRKSETVVYSVKLNESQGRIFWYERQTPLSSGEINQLAENIIESLQFESNPKRTDTGGEIAFTFHNS